MSSEGNGPVTGAGNGPAEDAKPRNQEAPRTPEPGATVETGENLASSAEDHDERAQPEVKVVDRRWWARPDRQAGEVEEPVRLKPTYVEELERQNAEKDRLLQEYIAKYRGAAGEFEDARARIRREVGKEVERGRRVVLVELLDVLDNLDRALEAAGAAASLESLRQGVDLVRRQFLGKLEGFGVRRIDALGEPFDPARHEAVSIVPTSNPHQDDRIIGIVKHGYQIHDEVLRPAAVAVGKCIPESGKDEG